MYINMERIDALMTSLKYSQWGFSQGFHNIQPFEAFIYEREE